MKGVLEGGWTPRVVLADTSVRRDGFAHQIVIDGRDYTVDHSHLDYQTRSTPLEDGGLRVERLEPTKPAPSPSKRTLLIAAAPDLFAALQAIFDKMDDEDGAPGHSHDVPGIWDADNTPDRAGKPCAWCAQWEAARAALHLALTGERK